MNKTVFILRSEPDENETEDEMGNETLVEEIENFLLYAWSDMYWLATLVVLMTLFGCFFAHHADLRQRMVGARMRIACCSLIYRKVCIRSILSNHF